MKSKRLALFLLLFAPYIWAQVPVSLAPVPKLQFFYPNGAPLAYGCVFTYQSNTTSPLATYTDYTGSTVNSNPVVLDGGGFASIWLLSGQAYTLAIKSSGGTNCASGSQQYSVNGIGGSGSQGVEAVPYSPTPTFTDVAENMLFTITLTGNASATPLTAVGVIPPGLIIFQITQDSVGGRSFSWPANVGGGAAVNQSANAVTTQQFFWDGTEAYALGPATIGTSSGPIISVGEIISSGDIINTGNMSVGGNLAVTGSGVFGTSLKANPFISATSNPSSAGTIRLANTDSILWRNNPNGANYGFIPSGDAFDIMNLNSPGGLDLTGTNQILRFGGEGNTFPMFKRASQTILTRLADDSADANISAAEGIFSNHISVDGVTINASACASNQVLQVTGSGLITCSNAPSIQAASTTILGTNVGMSNSPTVILTKSVTMPTTGCPCRALVSYSQNFSTSNAQQTVVYVNDGTNNFATGQTLVTGAASNYSVSASSFSTGTYNNGATITFSLDGVLSTSTATAIQGNGAASGQNSWMNIAIFTSN